MGIIALIKPLGCIAGPDGCLVKLSDAIKKPWPTIPMSPALAETPGE